MYDFSTGVETKTDETFELLAAAYGALPDRLYLIGKGGTVVFQGDQGPWGFDPAALEEAIRNAIENGSTIDE